MDIPDMANDNNENNDNNDVNDNYPNTEYDDDGLMGSNNNTDQEDMKFEKNDHNNKGYQKQSTVNSQNNKNGLGLAVTGIPMSQRIGAPVPNLSGLAKDQYKNPKEDIQ